jgi:hypothetical protein
VAHFLNSCTSAMRDRFEAIFANDSACRVLHYILGLERVLEWVHSVGVATDERSVLALVRSLRSSCARSLRTMTQIFFSTLAGTT